MNVQNLCRTRFVCISDTHNASPRNGCFKLPPGDVLIHAGDLSNQGTLHELRNTLEWIADSVYEVKIVIAGNHDVALDAPFYAEHGASFHNLYPQSSSDCIDLISKHPSITYLNHSSATIRLARPGGPHTYFKIFGSPYSPRSGKWAFMYEPFPNHTFLGPRYSDVTEAEKLWRGIPLDSDIVVTHTPARNHCDAGQERSCEALRRALWRVRPRMVVCGHIHEGWSAERVTWALEDRQVRWREEGTKNIELDREGKKLAKIDLTTRMDAVSKALDNDGSNGSSYPQTAATQEDCEEANKHELSFNSYGTANMPVESCFEGSPGHMPTARSADSTWNIPAIESAPGVLGLGGHENSNQCDRIALQGRLGRRETCFINAAIMAKSRGSRGGGTKYNKPIVVDIELPTWS